MSSQRSISSGALLRLPALGSLGVQLRDPGRAIVCIALSNLGSAERRGRDGLQLWDERVEVLGAMETLGEEVQGGMVERITQESHYARDVTQFGAGKAFTPRSRSYVEENVGDLNRYPERTESRRRSRGYDSLEGFTSDSSMG